MPKTLIEDKQNKEKKLKKKNNADPTTKLGVPVSYMTPTVLLNVKSGQTLPQNWEFLFLIGHPQCYSKLNTVKVLLVREERKKYT